MKDRTQEMQKTTFAVISIACFLVLCFVTFYNTYRMILLEAEVQEMRKYLEKLNPMETLNEDKIYVKKLNQYIPRQRRSLMGEDQGSVGPETNNKHTENYFEQTYPGFKGASGSESPVSDGSFSSINTIFPNQKGGLTKKSPNNITRTSKDMHNTTKGTRQMVKKSALKSLDSSSYTSNEFNTGSSESEFQVMHDAEVVSRRTRPRMQILDERHPRTGRIKPLPSINFSGDTSRYVLGTHHNFKGNGHLRHLQNIFVDWKPHNWVEKTGMMTHFEYDQGYLTIRESGLYFIYAQIYYLDEHDVNGYRVYKNDNIILQCTVSLHSGTRAQKGNTCYTAGVEYIAEGDKISLGDILNGHYSLFEPGKSFFGVVKLGDVRARV